MSDKSLDNKETLLIIKKALRGYPETAGTRILNRLAGEITELRSRVPPVPYRNIAHLITDKGFKISHQAIQQWYERQKRVTHRKTSVILTSPPKQAVNASEYPSSSKRTENNDIVKVKNIEKLNIMTPEDAEEYARKLKSSKK